MLRMLVVASVVLAAGPAFAEMAAPAYTKPAKEVTIRGCTGAGFAGCSTIQRGKDTVMLFAKPGVALPAPKTYIIAKGTLSPAEGNVCRATLKMLASKIIETRRACK